MRLTGKLSKTARVLDHTLKDRGSQRLRASRRHLEDVTAMIARFNGSVSEGTAAVR